MTAATLPISLTIELSAAEKEALDSFSQSFQTPDSDATATAQSNLSDLLTRIASAAAREYVDYLAGASPPGSIVQQRELRLSYLIEYVFQGTLPSEHAVSELLGLTPTEARNLIPRVIARHKRRLSAVIQASAMRALDKPSKLLDDKFRWISCDPVTFGFLADRLARLAGQSEAAVAPLERRTDAVGRYKIDEKAFELLAKHLGATYPPIVDSAEATSTQPPRKGRGRSR